MQFPVVPPPRSPAAPNPHSLPPSLSPFCSNLAVGGRYPGNATAASVFPNTLTIDYIRIFGSNVK